MRGLGKSKKVCWAQDETFLNLKTSFVTDALSSFGSWASCSLERGSKVTFLMFHGSWHLVMLTSSHMESLMTAFSACLNLDTSRARPAWRSRRRSARSIDDTLWMRLVNWTLLLGFSASSFSFSSSSTTSSCCLVPQRRAPLVWWCRIFNLQSTLSLETCKCCHWRTAKYGIFQHNVENVVFTLKILCRLVFCERRRSIRNRSISALPSSILPPPRSSLPWMFFYSLALRMLSSS